MMMGNQMNPMMMGNQMNPMMMGNQMNPMMMGNQMNPMMMGNNMNPMMMGNNMNPMMMGNQMNPMMMGNNMNPMMMGNQMNPMMMGLNQNNIQQDEDKSISLCVVIAGGKKISETLDLNTTISMLVKILETKHRINMNDYEMVFNAKRTDKNLTLAQHGMTQGSVVYLFYKHYRKGGEVGSCAKSIADPTKKAPVEWPTTEDGPFYLTVKNGINIFGFCQNQDCQAYKKEVCSPFGYGTFDLIEDLNSKSKKCPKCPACEYLLLEVESCGFMNCEYHYVGKKYENKKLVDVDFRKKTKGGYKAIDYIDPGKKGKNKSTWVELRIIAKKL